MTDQLLDRPEDIANRDYYNKWMRTRRVRVVVEADVEWRDDDPGYCESVAALEMVPEPGARLRNPRVVPGSVVIATGDSQRVGDDLGYGGEPCGNDD